MGKPVFGVSDKASFKPVSSATETSLKIEISPVASLHMILSKKRTTKVLIRLRRLVCSFCCSQTPEDRFSCVEAQEAYITNNMDPDQTASMGSVLLGISLIRDPIVCSHEKIQSEVHLKICSILKNR